MTRILAFALATTAALAADVAPALAQQDETTPQQIISALEGAYGVHPGQRRNHAKGTCALGSFVGSPDMAAYSRSALFSGKEVPVVARFSLAGGNPDAADTEKIPRGLGLEFKLPDGSLQHMTMINKPMFFATMPKTFLAGTLTITSASPQVGAPCFTINYDPLVMADGIAPTDDPVLLFRSPSYTASFVLRLQGK
jgi:catalase